MNISRTTLGRHIKKNNLKAGDEVTDFVLSVSEATSNKWSSANWIAYGKGYVVTSYAIEPNQIVPGLGRQSRISKSG
jgi:hypothetical protein